MQAWRRNLALVWISQFFSTSGFLFSLPFAAYYMQSELGVSPGADVEFWMMLFAGLFPASLAAAGPFWGAVADRFGPKSMLIRANVAAVVILFAMGLVPSVTWLIVLRTLQGFFTGTVPAAQALVAICTPHEKQGRALGALSSAVFSGMMAGLFFGGLVYNTLRKNDLSTAIAFFCASGLLLVATLLVVFFVKDAPAAMRERLPRKTPLPDLGVLLSTAPVLLLVFLVAMGRFFDNPILPLFVQELNEGLNDAELVVAGLGMTAAVGAILAGFTIGRLLDRFPLRRVGYVCGIGAALAMAVTGLAQRFTTLFVARFFIGFWAFGLDPVMQVWLSRSANPQARGSVFGWAVMARSLGWSVAAFVSVTSTRFLGRYRYAYFVSVGLYLLMLAVIAYVAHWMKGRGETAQADQPASAQRRST